MIILPIFYKVFLFFMNYNKLQKIISGFLIFFILTSFTIRVPFFTIFWWMVSADFDNRYNLVSIIVEKDLFDSLESEIERYAKDIQWVLENTKTIIIPTDSKTNPYNIASLNEKLYFEWGLGIDWLDKSSELLWTVIIWDLPLPVVFNWNSWEKTVIPYVDFLDKKYIYNHLEDKYLLNENAADDFKADIWHWIISPNTWTLSWDIVAVWDYFDKNHDFYQWTGNFELDNWIINWDLSTWFKANYEPYVFYFDQIRENESISYINYKWYQQYLNNIEDLAYNRFSKKLITDLKNADKASKQDEMASDLETIWLEWLDLSAIWWPNVDNVWDIQTRHFLKEYTKNFLEIFNWSTLWDLRKDVNNTWRYSMWSSEVNVDLIPTIVASIDELSKKIIKNVNNTFEKEIDTIVADSRSKTIKVPTYIEHRVWTYSWDTDSWSSVLWGTSKTTYTNILNWLVWNSIDSVADCSIYRWSMTNSWTLVEANRWVNIKTWIKEDIDKLQSESTSCTSAITWWSSLQWYWGKNTWLWVEVDNWVPKLKPWADKTKAILPLFDIWWAYEIFDENLTPSPEDCYDNNYIKTNEVSTYWSTVYNVPLSWNPSDRVNWSCKTDNIKYSFSKTYEDVILTLWSDECTHKRVYLDWVLTKNVKTDKDCSWFWSDDDCYCWSRTYYDYHYKEIPSYITHKSPTAIELTEEIQAMTTPSLPIDKDRYIDFINTSWVSEKVYYPYLFRLEYWSGTLTMEKVDSVLKEYLDSKRTEVWMDLYQYLKDKPDKTLTIDWEDITVSYYDTLVFWLYWNWLKSVPAKYKYIFENYLSDQTWANDNTYHFPLPLNKKSYEISYLWAWWDAANLYMRVDPEEKWKNPYADIMSQNINLKNQLVASNIWWDDASWDFKCAPPDWVPIWEWFPAVLCRLQEMLPPKIAIWENACWPDYWSDWDESDLSSLESCNKDDNKNWINDCLEEKIDSINLNLDSNKYFYWKSWELKAEIVWTDWKTLKWLSWTDIYFELAKVVIPIDSDKEFSWSNKKTIFDISMESSSATSDKTRELMNKYINFKNISIKSWGWVSDYNFSTKSKDADISFRVFIDVKDQHWNTVIYKASDIEEMSIRWDRFMWSTYNISKFWWEDYIDSWASSVVVSDLDNVYLVDSNNNLTSSEDSILSTIWASDLREKLVISLSNISKAWNILPINYPVEYEIYKDWLLIKTWSIDSLSTPLSLTSTHKDDNWFIINSFQKTWWFIFKFSDSDWFKFEKEIEFMPDKLARIEPEMSTTIQETGWVITTHLVKFFDKFNNLTKWENYELDIDIVWGWLSLEWDLEKDTYNVYEWYKWFTLKSSNIEIGTTNVINFTVTDEYEWTKFNESVNLTTLKDIPFDVNFLDDNMKVWNLSYWFEITVNIPPTASLNEMDKFNSRAYLSFPSIYWSLNNPYVIINNNNWFWEFTTKTAAIENLDVEVQIEWIREPKKVSITVYPEKPIRTELTLDRSSIEASPSDKSELKIELMDRYWNVCFNDNISQIDVEILDKYSDIISPESSTINSVKWVWKVKISWTETPWIWYFKTSVTPALENNTFIITDWITDLDKDWNIDEVIIKWISSNAWKISTYYFWNKSKIEDKKYNWIYTTLLWSNYWDITVRDYLAGALIFDKDNRSLAVTTLLNNPFKYNDVITVDKTWELKIITWWWDLSQNIELVEDWNLIHIYNKSLNTLIWKVLYNFDKEKNDLNEVDFEKSKILVTRDSDNLVSSTYLDVRKWNIILYIASSSYSTRSSYVGSSTNWEEWKIIWYRDPFESKKTENPFTTISDLPYSNFHNESGIWWKWMNQTLLSYSASRNVWESTKEFMSFSMINIWDPVISLKKIQKKLPGTLELDPTNLKVIPWSWIGRQFEDSIWDILDDKVSSYKVFDYNNNWADDIIVLKDDWHVKLYENTNIEEKFENKWSVILLSDLWSDAIMEVWDFTWDWYDDIFFVTWKSKPVLFNNNKKDFVRRDLDTAFNLEWRIIQAEVFDMDADWKDDIVTFDDSWTINIFYGSSSIPAMPKFTKELLWTWLWITLSNEPRTDWWFLYFDDLYQLPQDNQAEVVAKSKNISEAVTSNIDVLKSGWWMDSILPEWNINDAAINKFLFSELTYNPNNSTLVWDMTDEEKQAAILAAMPESIMTPEMEAWIESQSAAAWDIATAVSTWSTVPAEPEPLATPWIWWVDSAVISASEEMWDLLNWWLEDLNPWMNGYDAPNDNTKTTFIKSEYSDAVWVDIKKIYKDANWWTLKSDDIVDVIISITNNTLSRVDNIAFIDSIPKPFAKGEEFKLDIEFLNWTKSWTWNTAILKENIAWWDWYLLDVFTTNDLNIITWSVFEKRHWISLDVWEELVINYSLITSPFKFGFIQAWLFEKDEAWDDIYWDVAFKNNDENCWGEYKLYRSTDIRSYLAWIKIPPCDEDKAELPHPFDKAEDLDSNWIPDYIDKLTDSASSSESGWDNSDFVDFAENALADMNMDSDWDGLPDDEDSSPTVDDDEDFMDSLDNFTEDTMEVLEWVETILNWLSCWFGWGGCISMPVNAAPLAPWSSITVLWCPVAPAWPSNLFVAMSGIPIFSLLTLWPIMPFGIPTPPLWPPNFIWAWGIFGFSPWPLRIFLTPTLTWAIGTAICFWDNVASPYALFPWIYPLLSWWNCIIAAAPMFWCSDDWSDWDVASVWLPSTTSWSWDFWVINGNCTWDTWNEWKTPYLWLENAKEYIDFKKTWTKSSDLTSRLKSALTSVADQWNPWAQANWPLLNADMGWWPEDMSLSIDLDFSALADWNFWDILKVKLSRIWPFPDFIQSWVTRQVEEIVNKLTDFPTLFIILPDFSWIFDWWWEAWEFFAGVFDEGGSYDKASKKAEAEFKEIEAQIEALNDKCPDVFSDEWSLFDDTNAAACKEKATLEKKLLSMWMFWWVSWTLWGIKAAFKLISNLPLLSIQPEPVYVNVPWIDKWVLAKTIISRKNTAEQWKTEVDDTLDSWSCWWTCADWDDDCQAKNGGCLSIWLDMDNLINSLEKNIEILEWYKKFPEDLNKLIRIKEVRLWQILCYIDTIAFLLWGRIKKNWKIFKTWVELYVLIKAILKSWQLIIDIFYDFDAECHECKNERSDLRYCVLMLLSMLIPQIPIIVFPKWPDIIVDLHNIRAGLIIWIPDFTMKLRPILLPELPNLYLPKLPPIGISLELPALPILPEITLPELPMLPAIPTIELPDLPPAPKLPKLFAALEAILTILKILIKIYCLLQKSFLAPEWAAWQRIAHITERGWYLPLDFIPLELPNFSYPFIDAVKVTTYVNLEFEVDYIVEFARQLVMPINVFSNNVTNILNIWVDDLDFRDLVPESIDINIWAEWTSTTVDGHELNYNYESDDDLFASISVFTLASKLALWFSKIIEKIDMEKDDYITNSEFLTLVNNDINKKWILEDQSFDWLWKIWENANELIVSEWIKTDNLITELEKNSTAKFDELKNIINEELYKNNELLKNIENWELFKWLDTESVNTKISKLTYTDFDLYNDRLSVFNNEIFDNYSDIKNWNIDSSTEEELKDIWWNIIDVANEWMDYFNNYINGWRDLFLDSNDVIPYDITWTNNTISAKDLIVSTNTKNSLLATAESAPENDSEWSESACATWKPNTYSYEWLYISEVDPRDSSKVINYRLFNYLDDFTWDEEVNIIDYDNDWDDDLLYQIWSKLYLKTNLKIDDVKTYLTDEPITLDEWDNKFYNWDIFYEAVNGYRESVSSSQSINIRFEQPTNLNSNNFSVEYYNIVDKYTSIDKWISDTSFIPAWVKKSIIDSFSGIDKNTLNLEVNNDWTLVRKNLATLDFAWQVKWIVLTTNKLDYIKQIIDNNSSLVISEQTRIYTWGNSSQITYVDEDTELDEEKEYLNYVSKFTIPANSNIEFEKAIKIIWISWDAYLKSSDIIEYRWEKIPLRLNKPLFSWTSISVENFDVTYNESSHIDIKYYDWTTRYLMAREFLDYKLVDLWDIDESYQIQINSKNDFYYSKIRSFKNNIFSTESNQVILAPQLANDQDNPELNWLNSIKIPVYQDKTVNIIDYIYENWGHLNISDIYFDEDDEDLKWHYTTNIDDSHVNINFTSFDKIFKKKVKIYIKDKNDNIWEESIIIEVYSPIPDIITDNDITNVNWKLDDTSLTNEPVSLYRVRSWWITKINNPSTSSGVFNTIDSSIFNFWVSWWEWLTIKYSWWETLPRDIANINENTWVITNNIWSIKVLPSNDINNDIIYPKIIIEYWHKEIYYQSFMYNWEWEVNIIDSFDNIDDNWIYLKIVDSQFAWFSVSNNVTFNPWSVFVYDSEDVNMKPIFTVFNDGRINIDDTYNLEYSSNWDYPVLNIVNKVTDNLVWRVLIQTDKSFIIK